MLGDHSPQALVDTIFFLTASILLYAVGRNTESFVLIHHKLNWLNIQEREPFFGTLKIFQKITQGGLKGRKLKLNIVIHHENPEDPSRCFVRLFKLYQSKCPHSQPKDAFYLQPLKKLTENCWYSPRPIGHVPLTT